MGWGGAVSLGGVSPFPWQAIPSITKRHESEVRTLEIVDQSYRSTLPALWILEKVQLEYDIVRVESDLAQHYTPLEKRQFAHITEQLNQALDSKQREARLQEVREAVTQHGPGVLVYDAEEARPICELLLPLTPTVTAPISNLRPKLQLHLCTPVPLVMPPAFWPDAGVLPACAFAGELQPVHSHALCTTRMCMQLCAC